MKSIITNGKEKGTDGIDQQTMMDFQEGVMQAALGVMALAAVLVGAWGLLSLFGGITMGGGIMEMARSWISAIGGM